MIYRNPDEYVVVEEQVWIPLEITLSDEGFYRACRYGAREWNAAEANGTAALYRMSDSWKIYQPISVPGATAYFNIPESDAILLAFQNGAEEWKRGELRNDPLRQNIQFVALEEEEEEEILVIKGNPLSRKSFTDIVAIGNSVAALSPSVVREEERKDEELADGTGAGAGGPGDGDSGKGGADDEEELLENIIPLDYAIATATLQTDVQIKQSSEAGLSESELVGEAVAAATDADADADAYSFDDLSFFDEYIERATQAAEEEKSEVTDLLAAGDDFKFETTDDLLADLEAAAEERDSDQSRHTDQIRNPDQSRHTDQSSNSDQSRHPELDSGSRTKTIIIISSVTIAAVLAAGIIIKGKKRREEESK